MKKGELFTFDPQDPLEWVGGAFLAVMALYALLYGGWNGIVRRRIPLGNPPMSGRRAVTLGVCSVLLGCFGLWLLYHWLRVALPHLGVRWPPF